MAYASGFLKDRIEVLNRTAATVGKFGKDSAGAGWQCDYVTWANVSFVKGMRAMNESTIDVYGVVMVRTRWRCGITPRSRIVYHGDTYQILPETFHEDKQANIIQFNAQMLVDEIKKVNLRP